MLWTRHGPRVRELALRIHEQLAGARDDDPDWPVRQVGHQPTPGEAASMLLARREASWRFARERCGG